jgi:hypothetical protein
MRKSKNKIRQEAEKDTLFFSYKNKKEKKG